MSMNSKVHVWVVLFLLLLFLSDTHAALCPVALIFDGSVNPAHPKHIGSIDPSCDAGEVVKGNEWFSSAPVLLSIHMQWMHHPPTSICTDLWLSDCSCSLLFVCLFEFPDAYETSKMLCEQYYLTSPDMEITEINCKLCLTPKVCLPHLLTLA